MMEIRPETAADVDAIKEMTDAAFGGTTESLLVGLIRQSENFVPELSLVAVDDGQVIGHVLFSHVMLDGDSPRQVLSLAPLTVHPDHQNQGVGSALMATGIEAVRAAGEDIIVLEGHPSYYPRFGFERGVDVGIDKPDPRVPDDAFMVLFVDEAARGTTGKIAYPPAFHQANAIGP
jgi:putative acetyltransferase